MFDILTKNPDDTFSVRLKNKTTYSYNLDGKLFSITDRNQNSITIKYDASGYIDTVTGAGGITLDFTLVNGKVSTITDPAGRTITYTYSGDNLQQVQAPGGKNTTYVDL